MYLAFMSQMNQRLQFNEVYQSRQLVGQKTIRFSKPLPCGQDVLDKLYEQSGVRYRITDLIMAVTTLTLSELVRVGINPDRP